VEGVRGAPGARGAGAGVALLARGERGHLHIYSLMLANVTIPKVRLIWMKHNHRTPSGVCRLIGPHALEVTSWQMLVVIKGWQLNFLQGVRVVEHGMGIVSIRESIQPACQVRPNIMLLPKGLDVSCKEFTS
jgi:hypothetical protein